MSPSVKSLIFDLDGTLLDSRAGIVESFLVAAKAVFPTTILDNARVPVGPPIRQICATVFPGISAENAERIASLYRSHYDSVGCLQTRLFDGANQVLSEFFNRLVPIDVATNKPARVTESILSRLEIRNYFRSIASIDSMTPPFKDKTAILMHLAQSNSHEAEHTVYVGDTAEDAAAAKACGLRFVWASYGYGKLEDATEVFKRINSLAELKGIL